MKIGDKQAETYNKPFDPEEYANLDPDHMYDSWGKDKKAKKRSIAISSAASSCRPSNPGNNPLPEEGKLEAAFSDLSSERQHSAKPLKRVSKPTEEEEWKFERHKSPLTIDIASGKGTFTKFVAGVVIGLCVLCICMLLFISGIVSNINGEDKSSDETMSTDEVLEAVGAGSITGNYDQALDITTVLDGYTRTDKIEMTVRGTNAAGENVNRVIYVLPNDTKTIHLKQGTYEIGFQYTLTEGEWKFYPPETQNIVLGDAEGQSLTFEFERAR